MKRLARSNSSFTLGQSVSLTIPKSVGRIRPADLSLAFTGYPTGASGVYYSYACGHCFFFQDFTYTANGETHVYANSSLTDNVMWFMLNDSGAAQKYSGTRATSNEVNNFFPNLSQAWNVMDDSSAYGCRWAFQGYANMFQFFSGSIPLGMFVDMNDWIELTDDLTISFNIKSDINQMLLGNQALANTLVTSLVFNDFEIYGTPQRAALYRQPAPTSVFCRQYSTDIVGYITKTPQRFATFEFSLPIAREKLKFVSYTFPYFSASLTSLATCAADMYASSVNPNIRRMVHYYRGLPYGDDLRYENSAVCDISNKLAWGAFANDVQTLVNSRTANVCNNNTILDQSTGDMYGIVNTPNSNPLLSLANRFMLTASFGDYDDDEAYLNTSDGGAFTVRFETAAPIITFNMPVQATYCWLEEVRF